jgi:hypothetical protein
MAASSVQEFNSSSVKMQPMFKLFFSQLAEQQSGSGCQCKQPQA